MSEKRIWKNFVQFAGLVSAGFGLIMGIRGFVTATNASWGTSTVIQGFAELAFGILFMLFGIALIELEK